MKVQIVNPDPRYSTVKLIEPTTLGYLHIAARVQPRSLPFLPNGREKSELLHRLKESIQHLAEKAAVKRVTLFDAIVFAPPSAYVKEQAGGVHRAHFDIVVLVETTSPEVTRVVQTTPAYESLVKTLRSQATDMHIIAACNAKRVGDVDKSREGVFLFNYFVADDAQVALRLWDYLAGWYEVETGLDNSTLLVPLEGERSDYLAINHARWSGSLLPFLWRQMSKKSFRSYMQANLSANRVGAMPVLYRLV